MVAVLATRISDGKQVVFAVNLSLGIKYPDIDVVAAGFLEIISGNGGWISPLGDLIYVNGPLSAGQQQSDNAIVFDLNGNIIQTWLEYGTPSHCDLTLSVAGDEVAVGTTKTATQGVPVGHVSMRNLQTGILTDLVTGGFPTATSARNYGMPGWAVVDDTNVQNPLNYPPYDSEIYAVKLDGSKTVVRLGQAHGTYTDYQTQGFVVPSPSGTRIVFASDWNEVPTVPNSSLTWSAGVVTVTTVSPHGMGIGDSVLLTIAGVTPSGYNGVSLPATVTTTTQFTYSLATNPGVETVPGTCTTEGRPVQAYVIDIRKNLNLP